MIYAARSKWLCSICSDSGGLCRNGDDWRPSCSGWCTCVGYMTVAAEASAIIMGAGLLMSSLLLKETKDTHLEAEVHVAYVYIYIYCIYTYIYIYIYIYISSFRAA